jgi:hypothetical protein
MVVTRSVVSLTPYLQLARRGLLLGSARKGQSAFDLCQEYFLYREHIRRFTGCGPFWKRIEIALWCVRSASHRTCLRIQPRAKNSKWPGRCNSLPRIRVWRFLLRSYDASNHLDVPLGIAVVSGKTLQIFAYQLEHTPSESDAPYWVEQEVYAEVGVVQKHEVLL